MGVERFADAAKAAGIAQSWTVTREDEAQRALQRVRAEKGPLFCVAKVRFEELPLVLPPKDGVILRERFRKALDVAAD